MTGPGRDSTAAEGTSSTKSDTSTGCNSAANPKMSDASCESRPALVRSFRIDAPSHARLPGSSRCCAPILRLTRIPSPGLEPERSEATTYLVRAPLKPSKRDTRSGPKKRVIDEILKDSDLIISRDCVDVAIICVNYPPKCNVTKSSGIKLRWLSWFSFRKKPKHTPRTPPDTEIHMKNRFIWRALRSSRGSAFPEYMFDQLPIRDPCFRLQWGLISEKQIWAKLAPSIRTATSDEETFSLVFRNADNVFVATITRQKLDIHYYSTFAAIPGAPPSLDLLRTDTGSQLIRPIEGVAPKMQLEEFYNLIVATGVWVALERGWAGVGRHCPSW